MKSMNGLERKIDKHIKENADQMKLFKHELQSLKSLPKPKGSRPSTDTAKSKEALRKQQTIRPVKTDEKRLDCWLDPRMSKRANVQHHPGVVEMSKQKCRVNDAPSTFSTGSYVSQTSATGSAMARINYKGNSMELKCSPLKLIQFLVVELKAKLKDFLPDDDEEISKVLREINYAIKQAKLERHPEESSTNRAMINQTTQMPSESSRVRDGKQCTSKDIQTDLPGDEVEKLREFYDKYLAKQLKLDVDLRQIEEMFTLKLSKSSEKIAELTCEMNLLQRKLNDEISSSERTMAHRVDVKIEEMKGEIKFLTGVIEETRNHNLIDNMHKKLAQTNKKLSDVKRKCTEAAKHCLEVQLETLLLNSTTSTSKANEIGHELGVIKSKFVRSIAALKQSHPRPTASSTSFASMSSLAPSESIKSQAQWNEKMAKISSDDKFITIIDDGKASRCERFDKRRSMMEREINNILRQDRSASDDANETIEVIGKCGGGAAISR